MGKLLDELKEKASKLQKELDEINQQILKYENDSNLEKSDYENKIHQDKNEAISEFMDLLNTNDSELNKIEKLLEKYMISHEYEEEEGPEGYRPAQYHNYKFNMKDFELNVSISLERYHEAVESNISIYCKENVDDFWQNSLPIFKKDLKEISKVIVERCKDKLSDEEINDYSLIFYTLQQADIEDFDRFC